MRCTKCGCELPENSKFCFACGAKLEENCVEAQKKELAENLEQEDCQANEGDEEETVLLGAEIRGSYSSIVHIVDVKMTRMPFSVADVERIWKWMNPALGKMQEVLNHWDATRAERFHPEKSLVWQRQLSLSSEGLLFL